MIVKPSELNNVRMTLVRRNLENLYSVIIYQTNGLDNIVEHFTYRNTSSVPYTSLEMRTHYKDIPIFHEGDVVILESLVPKLHERAQFEIINYYVIGEISYSDNISPMIHARDYMHFANNSEHAQFVGASETPTTFITRTCEQYNFKIDNIINIPFGLNSHVWESETLYNMWVTVLSDAIINTGEQYRIKMTALGVKVEKVLLKTQGWLLEASERAINTINTERITSIFDEEFANFVITYLPESQDRENDILGQLAEQSISNSSIMSLIDEESIKRFGISQKKINVNGMTSAESEAAVNRRFKPFPIDRVTISLPGMFGFDLFDSVYVFNQKMNLSTGYYINGIEHKVSHFGITTTLQLSKFQDIPFNLLKTMVESTGSSFFDTITQTIKETAEAVLE